MFKREDLLTAVKKRNISSDIYDLIMSVTNGYVNLDLDTGPWIAGGCLTSLFQNRNLEQSDIDIFCQTGFSFRRAVNQVKKQGMVETRDSSTAKTFRNGSNGFELQIIKFEHHTLSELLQSFDFTIVKAATDGKTLVYHPRFFEDLKNYSLRLDHPITNKSRMASRVVKYANKGFILNPQTAAEVIIHKEKNIFTTPEPRRGFY